MTITTLPRNPAIVSAGLFNHCPPAMSSGATRSAPLEPLNSNAAPSTARLHFALME
ncbi:MAG: hypothetical protein HC933_03150 [Pleurocapsa sp. SU_196_0]|nr:hypothetical protein [Pleurocapsa sp. SU_196_0]